MKGSKTVSLFAALSIILAALVTIVSPIVDADCGTNQFHFVGDSGEVVDSFAKEESIAPSNTGINESRSKQPLDSCDRDGEASHMHGTHSHMMVIPTPAAIDFDSPSLIASSSILQLAESDTSPPAKPPRFST